jgi:hypothetical protein
LARSEEGRTTLEAGAGSWELEWKWALWRLATFGVLVTMLFSPHVFIQYARYGGMDNLDECINNDMYF